MQTNEDKPWGREDSCIVSVGAEHARDRCV